MLKDTRFLFHEPKLTVERLYTNPETKNKIESKFAEGHGLLFQKQKLTVEQLYRNQRVKGLS